MNFASAPFILLFLPLTLAGFHLIRGPRAGARRMAFLLVASAVFYASSGWQNVLVLSASIGANFFAARTLLGLPAGAAAWRKRVLWLAIIGNVGLLLGFKISILGSEGPDGFSAAEDVLLPLALSFVTFQQVGFVASVYRGTVSRFTLPRYLFFVLFFPQLVMGPIVRFEDIDTQLDRGALAQVDSRWVTTGAAVFCFGLMKKLVLANGLAGPTDAIFEAARAGPISGGQAWYGVIAFQLQLFFDFSAYGEMAIGLAMMLGMKMPLNFDRPLFGRDRADLWRRWHISFSVFMRGNVFMPLARHWGWPIPLALAATGILAGLWHGLGPTFVAWGLAQTVILLWLHFRNDRRRRTGRQGLSLPFAIAATFLTTCLIGALFRASDLAAAGHIYGALIGNGGVATSASAPLTPRHLAMLIAGAAVAWIAPDLGQVFRESWQFTELRRGIRPPPVHWSEPALSFAPTGRWGLAAGVALAVSLMALASQGEASRFVYVQF
jgi:D-alanyl-lipoteichoic acid acyltransferase DltB (MBOAT superfamily)